MWKSIRILSGWKINLLFWINFTLKVLTEFCQFHPKHSQTWTKFEGKRHWWDEKRNLPSCFRSWVLWHFQNFNYKSNFSFKISWLATYNSRNPEGKQREKTFTWQWRNSKEKERLQENGEQIKRQVQYLTDKI